MPMATPVRPPPPTATPTVEPVPPVAPPPSQTPEAFPIEEEGGLSTGILVLIIVLGSIAFVAVVAGIVLVSRRRTA